MAKEFDEFNREIVETVDFVRPLKGEWDRLTDLIKALENDIADLEIRRGRAKTQLKALEVYLGVAETGRQF